MGPPSRCPRVISSDATLGPGSQVNYTRVNCKLGKLGLKKLTYRFAEKFGINLKSLDKNTEDPKRLLSR